MPKLKPTGHKGFDHAAAECGVMRGNVTSGTQCSTYIRPFNQTECNGFTREPGVLQDFDLKPWLAAPNLRPPKFIIDFIKREPVDKALILYAFFHYRDGKISVHGYVVTTDEADGHDLLSTWLTGPTYKSNQIMIECCEALAAN